MGAVLVFRHEDRIVGKAREVPYNPAQDAESWLQIIMMPLWLCGTRSAGCGARGVQGRTRAAGGRLLKRMKAILTTRGLFPRMPNASLMDQSPPHHCQGHH